MSPRAVKIVALEQDRDDHGRFGASSGEAKAATDSAWKADRAAPKIADIAKGNGGAKAANAAAKAKIAVAGAHADAAAKNRDAAEKASKIGDTAAMVHHSAEAAKHDNAARVAKHEANEAKQIAKHAKGAAMSRTIGFARAIEATVEGDAPNSARLWRFGLNTTDKGDLYFTAASAVSVMAAYAARGNPLAWYYEHEDRVPLAQRGGCPMKGVCSAPNSGLAIKGTPEAPECWAKDIQWTDEARRQIVSGERRQLSPIAAYDEETREIVEILNVSLCAEGATHHGTLLASREGRQGSVDELIQKMQDAIDATDWEALESLAQEAEAAGGDEMARYAKMARAAMKAGKGAPAPKPATEAPPVATQRLAAARAELAAASREAGMSVAVAAFDRAATGVLAELNAATKRADAAANRSDRQTVMAALSRAREDGIAIDGIDERQHLAKASPEATEEFLSSLRRKANAGILVASKDGAILEAKPKKDEPKIVTVELTAGERAQMDQHNRGERNTKLHLTEADILASRTQHGGAKPAGKTVA